jgi:S-adenosylmethionine-diacylglycerol 3-amino-3-carboxypropyl transferase
MSKLKVNKVQFSVVREDPEVEIQLFRKFQIERPVLIGSGGCTAFSLASEFSNLPIMLIEPNPSQIGLIHKKIKTLKSLEGTSLNKKFGVGASESANGSLIEQGNFETLFRGLRNLIFDFIIDKSNLKKLIQSDSNDGWKAIFAHPYWTVAFDLYLNNSILKTMFGSAAIQHAPPESYSRYFRSAFEKGLLRADRKDNYFLHHLLLGYYPKHENAWPVYLQRPPKTMRISTFQGMAQDFADYSNFDFVGLSNIFDWSSEAEIKKLVMKLRRELKPGALVVYRQLNNSKNFRSYFGSEFDWLKREAERLHKMDRSLFYSSIQIARKVT